MKKAKLIIGIILCIALAGCAAYGIYTQIGAVNFDEIIIDNPQVVAKSYPHFWKDLQQAGFIITPID